MDFNLIHSIRLLLNVLLKIDIGNALFVCNCIKFNLLYAHNCALFWWCETIKITSKYIHEMCAYSAFRILNKFSFKIQWKRGKNPICAIMFHINRAMSSNIAHPKVSTVHFQWIFHLFKTTISIKFQNVNENWRE